MKVKELIEKLQECNPEQEVVFWKKYEGEKQIKEVENSHPAQVVLIGK